MGPDVQARLVACLAKLDAIEAELRKEEDEYQRQGLIAIKQEGQPLRWADDKGNELGPPTTSRRE